MSSIHSGGLTLAAIQPRDTAVDDDGLLPSLLPLIVLVTVMMLNPREDRARRDYGGASAGSGHLEGDLGQGCRSRGPVQGSERQKGQSPTAPPELLRSSIHLAVTCEGGSS